MQFIVKPANTYRLFHVQKFTRLYGQHVLYTFAFVIVFSSGLLFGLMWNFDNRCLNSDMNNAKRKADVDSGSQKSVTSSEPPKAYLHVLIVSCAQNAKLRTAIRETWLRFERSVSVEHRFVIGTSGLSERQLRDVQNEQATHNDLLLLSPVQDTYAALTEKVLTALRTVAEERRFEYLLKVDDDTFVRLDRLIEELLNMKRIRKRLYWGYFDGRASIKRRGQWKETSWFLCDKYLPYAVGGGYLLSADLVQFIANNSESLQLYRNEDVSVGVWLSPLKVDRIHEPRFDTEYESRGCLNNFLISHKQTPDSIREKYENITKTGRPCREEYIHRNAYVYNWRVPPSQCCVRNISVV